MRILLGVGGGIAAYKAAELARLLMEQEHSVQAVMTAAAQEFITPMTFAALTGRKTLTDLFAIESAIEHISVAQEHDLLVIAPATADLLGKLANGLAGDFLTTLYLAFTGPVVLAPAMNVNMWQHPATQANVETLRRRGHRIVEPGSGYLACGMTGPGRLAEPEAIAAAIALELRRRTDLEGETVLLTAGPTEEPLDPVRFISNRSSGKMGYALAEAAAARGARVILVSGPVHLPAPRGVEVLSVRTAAEMRDRVLERLPAPRQRRKTETYMPCNRAPGTGNSSTGTFTNWARNVQENPQQIYQPTTLDQLVAIVKQAEAKSLHVHAVGSGWSFTDVMIFSDKAFPATTPDYLVDTLKLNGVPQPTNTNPPASPFNQPPIDYGSTHMNQPIVQQKQIPTMSETMSGTQYPNDPVFGALTGAALQRDLCHVEAGIKIADLYTMLERNRLQRREAVDR